MEKTKKIYPAVVQIVPVVKATEAKHTHATYIDVPKKQSSQAVGFDVMPNEIRYISENEVHVYTGWRMKPPKGFKIVLVPRSSITKTNWILQNTPGQGDPDFRGEFQFRFKALPTGLNFKNIFTNIFRKKSNRKTVFKYDPFPFKNIACGQIFLEKDFITELKIVKSLDKTERGEGGYGSTDNKTN